MIILVQNIFKTCVKINLQQRPLNDQQAEGNGQVPIVRPNDVEGEGYVQQQDDHLLQHNIIHELPGKREGSVRYFYNGYVYHVDSRNEYILRCSMRSSLRCPGKIIVNDNNIVEFFTGHADHAPDMTILEKELFKNRLIERSRETFNPYEEIFNDAVDE